MKRTYLHDEAPCIVVGDTLAALYWAATLQRSTYTILLTTSDVSRDPYMMTPGLDVPPQDVLKPGTVLQGNLMGAEDGSARIATARGTEFHLPARVILQSETSESAVQGETPVMAGDPAVAISTALEHLATPVRHHVVCRVRRRDDTHSSWSSWLHVIHALGGTVETASEPEQRENGPTLPEIDAYGRLPGRECTFILPWQNLSEPAGTLYENISTCALSTGRYPLSLKPLRGGHHRQPPVVLSRRARVNLIRRGFARLALAAHSRERRVEEASAALTAMRVGSHAR